MTTKHDTAHDKGHQHKPADHAKGKAPDAATKALADKVDENTKAPAIGDKDRVLTKHERELLEGEHITQSKPTLGEAMAQGTGGNAPLDAAGEGSVEELAPAVRSAISDTDRVVQQGDEVIVHGRAIIDGNTKMHGIVLKVNQSGSIAVRVQRGNGTTYDVPGEIHNRDLGTGEWYWSWPEKDELDVDHKKA